MPHRQHGHVHRAHQVRGPLNSFNIIHTGSINPTQPPFPCHAAPADRHPPRGHPLSFCFPQS